MAKLLSKFVSQERISVKEDDETKEQFLKGIKDLATVEEEKLLNFNKFTDIQLYTFYAKLSTAEYSALWKVFVIIFMVNRLLNVDSMQIWLLIISLIIL